MSIYPSRCFEGEAAEMITSVIWVSGGKDSTALALRLAELHPEIDWRYVCTPTGDELPDVLEHWKRLECILKKPIEQIRHKHTLNELIENFGSLPSHKMRWCTRMLKIEVAKAWYAKNAPCIAYIGLRADEPERQGGIFGATVDQRYPLREWGWRLQEVQRYLVGRGISIPKRTDCARCYDQRLSEWWELWKEWPEIYSKAEEQEAAAGHTFRSPQRDTWPVSLKDLRASFQRGKIPPGVETNLDLFGDESKCRACSL